MDGHPDFQGVYDVATLTPLERPAQFGTSVTMTDEQARRLERTVAERSERLNRPSDGNRPAPPIGGDGSTGAAGNVGGYNNFWIDPGTAYFAIEGLKRTSVIIDPPDGKIPALTPAARQRNAARIIRTTSDAAESNDPGLEGPGAYDDPERRPLGERCLLGFGSTSGPPALPVLYNNLHQIVQTRDQVLRTALPMANADELAAFIEINLCFLRNNAQRFRLCVDPFCFGNVCKMVGNVF